MMLVGREMTIGKSNQGQERTDMFDYNRWPSKTFSKKLFLKASFLCLPGYGYVRICLYFVCVFLCENISFFLFLND